MATYRETQFLPQFNKNQSTSRVEAFYGPWKSVDEFLASRPGMFALECKDVITIAVMEDGIAKEYWNPTRTSDFILKKSGDISKETIWNYMEEYFANNLKPQINSSSTSKYIMYQDYEDLSIITIDIKANGYAYKPSKVNLYLNNNAKVFMKLFNRATNECSVVTLEKDPISIQASSGCLEDNQLILTIYPNIVTDVAIRAEVVNLEDNSIAASTQQFVKIGYLGEEIENAYLLKQFTQESVISEIWNNHHDYIEKINEIVVTYNDIQVSMPHGAYIKFNSEYAKMYYLLCYCYDYVVNGEVSSLSMDNLNILEGYIEDFITESQNAIYELKELIFADEDAIFVLEDEVNAYESSLSTDELESKSTALQEIHSSIDEIKAYLETAQGLGEYTESVEYTFEYKSKEDDIDALREQFEAIK